MAFGVSPSVARADDAALVSPGAYENPGTGSLELGPVRAGRRHIEMHTSGANGHMCELEGTLKGGELVTDDASEPRCKVTLTLLGGTVRLEANEQCTMMFCGMRARLDGDYESPPAGCSRREITKRRNELLTLHRKKKFAAAAEGLEQLLSSCERFLGFGQVDWVRNDLAIAQARAGRLADCRDTLQPLIDLSKMSDRAIRENNLPMEGEVLMQIAQATRVNLRICAD